MAVGVSQSAGAINQLQARNMGVLKNGDALSCDFIFPFTQDEFTRSMVGCFSWGEQAALKVELEEFGLRGGAENITNKVEQFFIRIYTNTVGKRLQAYLINLIADDEVLNKVGLRSGELAGLAHSAFDRRMQEIDVLYPLKPYANEAEEVAALRNYYQKKMPDAEPLQVRRMIDMTMATRRDRGERGNIVNIRRRLLTSLSHSRLAVSNNVWCEIRSSYMHAVFRTNIAHEANLATPTDLLTNRFLLTIPDRYPYEFLVSEKLPALRQFEASARSKLLTNGAIGFDLLQVPADVSLEQSGFGRGRTSGNVLLESLPVSRKITDLPLVFYLAPEYRSTLVDDIRIQKRLFNRSSGIVVFVKPPERSMTVELAMAMEPVWRKFLAEQGEISTVYGRILDKFESINTNCFPRCEEFQWIPSPKPRFGGMKPRVDLIQR